MVYNQNDFDTNETPQERAIREFKIAAILAAACGIVLFVAMFTHGYFTKLRAFINLYIPMAGF